MYTYTRCTIHILYHSTILYNDAEGLVLRVLYLDVHFGLRSSTAAACIIQRLRTITAVLSKNLVTYSIFRKNDIFVPSVSTGKISGLTQIFDVKIAYFPLKPI